MITFAPFRAGHAMALDLQPAQAHVKDWMGADMLKALEGSDSHTLLKDGKPVFCGGAVEIWENRGLLWSLVGGDMTKRDFVEVHYLAKQYLGALKYRRLEMYVDVNFENGHRWAAALGFRLEASHMEAFQPNGSANAMYAKVRM